MNTCLKHTGIVVVFDHRHKFFSDEICPLCDAQRQIDEWEKKDADDRNAKVPKGDK